MPRGLRIFVPGGIYHVDCRVARGERVFARQSEVGRWVDAVAFVSRLHDLSILAWCLIKPQAKKVSPSLSLTIRSNSRNLSASSPSRSTSAPRANRL